MEHFHSSNIYPNAGRISCMEHLIRTNGTNKIAKYGFNKSMYFDISDAEWLRRRDYSLYYPEMALAVLLFAATYLDDDNMF